MNRKQLEIDLAYAERDRAMSAGKLVLNGQQTWTSTSASGKILPLEGVSEIPEWLGDGRKIRPPTGDTYVVVIGNERLCLVEGDTGRHVVDTALIINQWAAAV